MATPERNLKEIPDKSNDRKYQRYALKDGGDTPAQVEVIVEGQLARLVDFSVGGLYLLSKTPFSLGATVSFSVSFENRGKIDMTGTVVRAKKEGDMWGIAIDLSKNYKPNTVCKV